MQLECLLCMAYINFDKKDWQQAQYRFDEAYDVAKECKETHIAEQCLCNSGIASGHAIMEEKQKIFQTLYQGGSAGAGLGGSIEESWSDEEDDSEAEY